MFTFRSTSSLFAILGFFCGGCTTIGMIPVDKTMPVEVEGIGEDGTVGFEGCSKKSKIV